MSHKLPTRYRSWILALALGIFVAFGAAVAQRAMAVSDSEELFTLKPGDGPGAGEIGSGSASASSPVTGHFYIADSGSFALKQRRVSEFTPWGAFVKAFGWDVAPGAVNEQQELRIRAAGGQFKLSFEGATTPSLAFDAPASSAEGTGSVEAALNSLSTVGGAGGSVMVTGTPGTSDGFSPFVYVIAFKGSLAASDVPQLQVEDGDVPLSGGQPVAESQVLTRANGGPPGVGLEACTAESGCRASTANEGARAGELGDKDATESSLTVDSSGNIYVASLSRIQKFAPDGTFLLMFGGGVVSDGAAGTGDLSAGSTAVTGVETTSRFFEIGQIITGAGIQPGTTISALGAGTITLSKPASSSDDDVALVAPVGTGNVPMNARQTIGVGPTQSGEVPTGGTFTLSFETPNPSPSNQTTAPIPRDATAAEVESSLGSLSTLTAAEIDVSGSAGGPWTVEFTGPRYGNATPPPLRLDPAGLTPSNPSPYVATFEQESTPEVCEEAQSCRRAIRGVGDGEFGFTVAMAASGSSIFATANGKLQRFGQDGVFETAFSVSGGAPVSLASAPAGDVYAIIDENPRAAVRLSGSTGAEVARLPLATPPSSVTSDGERNVYTVDNRPTVQKVIPERVVQYSPAMQPLNPQYCCESASLEGENYLRIFWLSANVVGDLLVHYRAQPYTSPGYSLFRMFGPSPARLEAPPRAAPDIEAQFATAVGRTSATVAAFISPKFWSDTRYRVEYGTEPCSTGGCNQTVPADEDKLLTTQSTSSGVRSEGLEVEGLKPNTTYYFRFVAESSGGGPVRGIGGTVGTPGAESSFTTYPTPPPAQSCPNQAFRTGASASLPDCRAYEMVSPVDKAGGDVSSLLNAIGYSNALSKSSISGERMTYSSYRAFADSKASPQTAQYIATRGTDGWVTQAIAPPRGNAAAQVYPFYANFENEYKAFSDDLCSSWLVMAADQQLAPGATEGYSNLFRQETCGSRSYETLVPAQPTVLPKDFETELQGTSADGKTAIVRIADKLTPDALGGGVSQTYYARSGGLTLLCILPDGSPSAVPCSGGTSHELSGNLSAFGYSNHVASVSHALSNDGRRAYWTAVDETNGDSAGTGRIYLRINPGQEQSDDDSCDDPGKACTVAVSGTKSSAPARFLGASPDGSRALYEFVEGSLAGNLYKFDLESQSSTLIARKTHGVAGGGESLEQVYFVSEEKLAGTQGATAGKPNLYLSDEGSATFIATLSALDVHRTLVTTKYSASNVDPRPVHHSAIASADGSKLAFTSTLPLTGYDNTDVKSPLSCVTNGSSVEALCDSEVFLYEAGSEGPVCISCNPSGAAPAGRVVEIVPTAGIKLPTAASLPLAKNQLYRPRVFSSSGDRLFFNSFDSLSLRDTDNRMDVYEWQAAEGASECDARGADIYAAASEGCLSLISGGNATTDSEFLDASATGENIFFSSNQSLLPQDPGQIDVYVARVGGGFPPPVTKPIPCDGEGCQATTPAPPPPSVGSHSAGPGNPKPKPRCRKGTRRVERKGSVRCVKKKKGKPSNGKSKAKSGKRAGR